MADIVASHRAFARQFAAARHGFRPRFSVRPGSGWAKRKRVRAAPGNFVCAGYAERRGRVKGAQAGFVGHRRGIKAKPPRHRRAAPRHVDLAGLGAPLAWLADVAAINRTA
ncbi:hypothetical protein ATO11_00515 [Pseudaestuariivita atlantica]|uniref:Uncharacterized protein n=1 Tax=Pseudaestuariivita atlantica TaxID=1317121 RepID=A0A0L1JTU5_9RHOB|nr:hypothetical protein ATO11_00515 [Pseudaestuariivita atlantica]